jgi:hypothetical protein
MHCSLSLNPLAVYIILVVEFTLIMKGVAVAAVILVSISLKQASFGET